MAPAGFERLAARLPLELVRPAASSDVAGHYTGQTSELEARVGPFMGGEDLYLFPDGSYVYCEWTDVMPRTVFDKGKWSVDGSLVELVSDREIRWNPEVDRQHIVVRRKARKDEILLVATPRDVEYFEQKAADDPELMLLIVGMVRTEILADKTAPGVKARLMKQAWNPTLFRK